MKYLLITDFLIDFVCLEYTEHSRKCKHPQMLTIQKPEDQLIHISESFTLIRKFESSQIFALFLHLTKK